MNNKKYNFWMFLILSIVTCGLYVFYFYYKFTEDVKEVTQDSTLPSGLMVVGLTILTCGFYVFYWIYKMSKALNEYGLDTGAPSCKDPGTVLLWAILGYFMCGVLIWAAFYMVIEQYNGALEELY